MKIFLTEYAASNRIHGKTMVTRSGKPRRKAGDPPFVAEVRQELGVDRKTFSRLTGYSERAIANWESGRTLSPSARQRIAEIRRIQEALARVMKPASIGRWIETPNAALGGLKPLEIIERGEIDRLWRVVFHLEAGTPA
jgi:DNA-binding transcriptional regulator YiaG